MMYADKRTVLRAVWAIVLTVVLAAAIVFGGGFIAPVAYAEGAEYSNVLDDLQKDETFDISQYPADDGDHNLYVEQVAESTDGELFLYVYQPYTGTDYDLTAASVNISTGINDNLYYENYGLTLLNSSGVFHKYLVEGFEVKADALRYYDISAIYRNYYGDIDDGLAEGDTSTIGGYAIEVAKLFTACTVNGEVSYTCTDTTVVTIRPEQKYVGYVRYLDGYQPGFWWVTGYDNDRWYIAFDSDFEIGDLYEADVMYSYRTYKTTYTWWGSQSETEYGEAVTNHVVTLSQDRIVENELTGIWGVQHEWREIESVETFISTNDLTEETIQTLSDKQWVLSFASTEYIRDGQSEAVTYSRSGTEIYDVSILRLKFETEGTVYNLGVVDSMVTPDPEKDPDNNPDSPDLGNWGDGPNVLVIILGVLALLLLLPLLIWLLPKLITFVFWLVSLPFKGISSLWKSGEEKRKRRKEERAKAKMDKEFDKFHKETAKKRKRMERDYKKVDVEKLKQDIWSGRKEEFRLTDTERYALEHDDEWMEEKKLIEQIMYGGDDDYPDW